MTFFLEMRGHPFKSSSHFLYIFCGRAETKDFVKKKSYDPFGFHGLGGFSVSIKGVFLGRFLIY